MVGKDPSARRSALGTEASNPAVYGMAEATLSYVKHLYALAAVAFWSA